MYYNCINKTSLYFSCQEDRKFTEDDLISLSEACYEAYKFHLINVSPTMEIVGREEYNIVNKELISLILPFQPSSFSFSISQEPSLHFFVRFPVNTSLFVETYLDIEDGHDTYIQIYKSGELLLELNCMFDDSIFKIREVLEDSLSIKVFNIPQISKRCSQSQ